jgi:Protein of unknown function (DUF1553)/Protein of unknown function (DUF1549)/Planctomycete cytochrome C
MPATHGRRFVSGGSLVRRIIGLAIVVVVVASSAKTADGQDAGFDFFEKKIRPVFAEQCYSCHSADAKKLRGGLLLDTKEAMLKGGDTGPALVPQKPKESLLIKALRYDDPELRMPPKGKLPDSVIADFEKWVSMGAPDPRTRVASPERKRGEIDIAKGRKFWAFQPPKRAPIPTVNDPAWPNNDIDRFVLAKLEAKGLKPAPDAEPATLLRRLYFVLIGLPPTPDEIDEFLRDCASANRQANSAIRIPQSAIVKVVDRLLASPHFGERWGRHWLDVARFAESSGGGRSLMFRDAWRYRDYVIRAFNTDMPFTQFISEQLAGDLLQAKTPEERYWQLVATAFLLLGPTNFERQDKPTLEMDVIDEQLDTLGKAFLGMTIGCARCHDHKFDPIPTRDYYALAGIFKSTKFIVHDNVSKWMTQPLPLLDARQEIALKDCEAQIAALKQQIKAAKAQLAKAGVGAAPEKGMPIAVADLPGIVVDDAQAKIVGKWKQSTFTNYFVGQGYLYDDRAMKGEKTVTFQPEFKHSGFYEVRFSYVPHENRATKVGVRIFHTDGDDTVYVNQKKTPPIAGRWVSLGIYRFEQGSQWFVMVTTEGANGHVVADAVQFLSADDLKKETKLAAASTSKPSNLQQLETELKRLEAQAADRPIAMAVTEGDSIGDIHIALRGNYHNKGDRVARGFLQVATLGPIPTLVPKSSGRRELAAWLANPDNPLTARVFANRVWHHIFGAGLVRTVDNFGNTGDLPSHPELLDYLAVRFMQEGWSLKQLIREIVLSRTFQMSSEPNDAGAKLDPENRLLWRMNRRRLDAESLRDAILAVSGQLDRTVFGNNVKKGTVVERDYQFEDTRRSIYAPVFRNRLLELFEVFDFPDPNMVMGKRNVSTVPTQALYLMNSPFVMAQARHTAESLLKMNGLDDAQRIDAAYRKALGRLPTERERRLALDYLHGMSGAERLTAWDRFCQTLIACLDYRYVN